MKHKKLAVKRKKDWNSDCETITKGITVWAPIFITSLMYAAFNRDGFNGIDVVCFYLILLNLIWFGFTLFATFKSITQKKQIIIGGFFNVSVLICFQIMYPDWYIYSWIAAVLGLIALLRVICSTPEALK